MSALKPKQDAFCGEYLVDLNGAAAAIRAGYAESGARQEAHRLLANPAIQERIAALQAERAARTAVTADKVLAEAGRIAFAKLTDVVRWGTREISVGFDADGKRLSPQDLGDAAMVHTEMAPYVEPVDSDDLPEHVRAAISEVKLTKDGLTFKMHGKTEALNLAGRHLGMFIDRHEHSGPNGAPIPVDDSSMAARLASLFAEAEARKLAGRKPAEIQEE
jgi:phage terminase small subunit